MSEVRQLGSSEPMTFATFQALELFRLLTILRIFDNFSTNLPPPPSTPSYSTAIWVALADESVDELVLSIKVSGAAI